MVLFRGTTLCVVVVVVLSVSLSVGVLPSLICISIRLSFDSLLFLLRPFVVVAVTVVAVTVVCVLSRIHLFLFASIQLCDLRWLLLLCPGPDSTGHKTQPVFNRPALVIEILCRSQSCCCCRALLLLFSVTEIDQKDREPIELFAWLGLAWLGYV